MKTSASVGGGTTFNATRARIYIGPYQVGDRLREVLLTAGCYAQDGSANSHITVRISLAANIIADSDAAFDALTKVVLPPTDLYPTFVQNNLTDTDDVFRYVIPLLLPPLTDERYVVIDILGPSGGGTAVAFVRLERDGY